MSECTNKRVGEMIALFEFGGLDNDQRRRFLDHLVECNHCYAEVYDLEPVMAVFRGHRNEAQQNYPIRPAVKAPSPFMAFRSWRLVPALATLAIMLAGVAVYIVVRSSGDANGTQQVMVTPDGGPTTSSPWRDIEVPKAPYTRPKQEGTLRGPGDALARAMTAYEAGNFAEAIELLKNLKETEPNTILDVNFYLGVSLLELGRGEEAISPLRAVVDSSSGVRLEAARYYLGLAYLKKNEPKQAVAQFDAVINMKGEYSAAATKLRRDVLEHL